jgi:hypothetical protein
VFEFPVVSRLLDILTFPVVYMSPMTLLRSMRFSAKACPRSGRLR